MLECLICHEEYNYSQNLPKTLPDCGHTICSACLTKIMRTRKCPECRKVFSSNVPNDARKFQTNVALQRIIEAMTNFCKEHQSPLTQICLTDKIKVCVNCVKYEGHKDHMVKSIESVKAEAKKKIQEYEKLEKDIEETTKQELEFLLNSQKEILKMIQEEDFAQTIDAKRKQYLWETESLFAQKKSEYQAKIANIISYHQRVANFKDILEEGEINKEYLQALEENIEYPPVEDETLLKEFLLNATQELESVLVSKMNNFTTTATSPSFQHKSFAEIHIAKLLGSYSQSMELAACLEVLRSKNSDIRLVDKKLLTISPQKPFQLSEGSKDSFFDIQNDLEKIDNFLIRHTHLPLTDEMVDGIYYIWKNLSSPISIRLDFDRQVLTEGNLFSCFRYPFWKTGSLETLCINLFQCQIESQNNFLKFLGSCGQRVPDLTGLSMFLSQTDMTDASVEALLKLIPLIFKNLQRFILSLANNKITQKSIANLFLFLHNLENLKEFSLNISETNIGESGVDTLFQGLHHLGNYEQLSLTLGSLPVKDKHIELLTQKYFKSAASRLNKLILSFDSTHLDASSIEKICCEVPKQLSALDLSFSRTKLTDANIQTLANSLAIMPDLSTLELDFKDTQVGDESIMALCETFSKDTTIIRELNLNFYNTKISEQTLRLMLTEVIPRISTLVKFHINVKKNYMGQEINTLVDQINKKYE